MKTTSTQSYEKDLTKTDRAELRRVARHIVLTTKDRFMYDLYWEILQNVEKAMKKKGELK